jgi:hypothetical protein
MIGSSADGEICPLGSRVGMMSPLQGRPALNSFEIPLSNPKLEESLRFVIYKLSFERISETWTISPDEDESVKAPEISEPPFPIIHFMFRTRKEVFLMV